MKRSYVPAAAGTAPGRVEPCRDACPPPPAASRAPAPAALRAPAWRDRLPRLEQRHWDLIGLGLVALAVFLAFLVYLGWDGGEVGDGARRRPALPLGAVHHLVPVALLAAGRGRRHAARRCRPCGPSGRRRRACSPPRRSAWRRARSASAPAPAEERGGLVGEALLEVTSTLLGTVGAHIVAVFFLLAGVLLLTGASVASVIKATGDSFSATGRRLRDGDRRRCARAVARRRTRARSSRRSRRRASRPP